MKLLFWVILLLVLVGLVVAIIFLVDLVKAVLKKIKS